MFCPNKIWRKWHKRINTNQKRYAVASALAASALPALVMARGHQISKVPEVPLVVANDTESLQKTKQAIALLQAVGAYDDVVKAKDSKKLRRGVGKTRNRRHVARKGPLVVYANDNGITKAFRNLPGVELADVTRLNLLQLAPGGHLGRFIVWTKNAFEALHGIYGSTSRTSTQKKGYTLPKNIISNSDITRIINSDEIQSKVRPAQKNERLHGRQKKNPLRNLGALIKVNPYALAHKRSELLAAERRGAARAESRAAARRGHEKQKKVNYARISRDDRPAPAAEAEVEEEEESAAAPAAPKAAKKAEGKVLDIEYTEAQAKYVTFSDDNCLGKKAPSLASCTMVQGSMPVAGKPIALLFWAQYHKPGFPRLAMYSKLHETFGEHIQFLAMSMDPDAGSAKKYIEDPAGKYSKEHPLTFPCAHDGGRKIQDAFGPLLLGPVNIPHLFIIDASGTIIWRQDHSQVGATAPTWEEQVTRQLQNVVDGTPLESNGPNQYPEEDDEEEDEEEGDEEYDEEEE